MQSGFSPKSNKSPALSVSICPLHSQYRWSKHLTSSLHTRVDQVSVLNLFCFPLQTAVRFCVSFHSRTANSLSSSFLSSCFSCWILLNRIRSHKRLGASLEFFLLSSRSSYPPSATCLSPFVTLLFLLATFNSISFLFRLIGFALIFRTHTALPPFPSWPINLFVTSD